MLLALLLQIQPAPVRPPSIPVLNGVQNFSIDSSKTWEQIWQLSIHGNIFAGISRAALTLTGFLIAIFVIKLAKEWMDESTFKGFNPVKVIPVVLVMILLTNGGSGAANLCDVVRGISNSTNTNLITIINTDLKVEQQLEVLRLYTKTRGKIYAISKECDREIRNDFREACLKDTRKHIDALMNSINLGDQAGLFLEGLQSLANRAVQDPLGLANNVIDGVKDATLSVIETPLLWASQLILYASQVAFQIVGEIAFILTACMAPFAIVGLLLPNGMQTFQVWISGFIGIGMFKFALNIITGLAATYSFYAGPTDLLPLSIVLGLLGPVLAALVASGGGFAIYNGLTAAAGTVVSIAAAIL